MNLTRFKLVRYGKRHIIYRSVTKVMLAFSLHLNDKYFTLLTRTG
jgi:hypothetical protein